MPRITYHTGMLDLHDLSYGKENELFAVNTLFSCISKFSSKYSFQPYWKPSLISEIEPEDRCHLNGMALKNGTPKFATALSKKNTLFSWRENITKDGDFNTRTISSYTNYYGSTDSYTYTTSGDWEFSSDKEDIEFEDNDGDKYDWEIKRLTNKELWVENGSRDEYEWEKE